MINACHDCGNALEECECFHPGRPMDFDVTVESVTPLRVEGSNLVCAVVADLTLVVTGDQADALGKAAFLAFWGGLAPYDWETTSNRSNWIAAGKAAALQHVKNRL